MKSGNDVVIVKGNGFAYSYEKLSQSNFRLNSTNSLQEINFPSGIDASFQTEEDINMAVVNLIKDFKIDRYNFNTK